MNTRKPRQLLKRSFTENQVPGYFTFFDKNKKERKRFAVRLHVPGTPFIVGAVVNIDEFFLPTQKRLQAFSGDRHGARFRSSRTRR